MYGMIKTYPFSKARNAEQSHKFCSSTSTIVTSLNDWIILERNDKQYTINRLDETELLMLRVIPGQKAVGFEHRIIFRKNSDLDQYMYIEKKNIYFTIQIE